MSDYNRYSAPGAQATESNTLYGPDAKTANQGAIYGPVPTSNPTPVDEYDDWQTTEFLDTPVIPTPNVNGFVPYRGAEQHGVRFNGMEHETPPAHYGAEQRAFENYIDPRVTPRDDSPVKPIRVAIVKDANLLSGVRARATNYALSVNNLNTYITVVQPERYRKKLKITAFLLASGTFANINICPEIDATDMKAFTMVVTQTTAGQVMLETEYTGPLQVSLLATNDAQGVRLSMWTEYEIFDGNDLL